jgi:hypothetical protein
MTTQQPDELDRSLRELTAWGGPTPGLWRAALDQTAEKPRSGFHRLLYRPFPGLVTTAVAAIILVVLAVGIILPSLDRAESSNSLRLTDLDALSVRGVQQGEVAWAMNDVDGVPLPTNRTGEPGALQRPTAPDAVAEPSRQSPASPDRHVIRNATLELITPDVRTAFAKAALLISDARGEYVQTSSLTGDGPTAHATLTLRIAADRLSEALNDLRQLGKVQDERTTGEDVTAQVVDLEARLRNEQRVEAELLELMSSRNDAPLKEILELRDSLSGIRQNIEQITAQRERFSRLVSLSTVLVIIRPTDEAPKPAAGSTLGAYFKKSIASSWRAGLVFLADTLSNILAVLIGGLIWWTLAAAILIALLRHRRRTAVLPPA